MSLLTVDNGVFEVLASHGDTYLGGEDFDQRVMQHFIKIFNKKTNTDMQKDKRAMQRLRREVETVKRALSSSHQARLELEALYDGHDKNGCDIQPHRLGTHNFFGPGSDFQIDRTTSMTRRASRGRSAACVLQSTDHCSDFAGPSPVLGRSRPAA